MGVARAKSNIRARVVEQCLVYDDLVRFGGWRMRYKHGVRSSRDANPRPL